MRKPMKPWRQSPQQHVQAFKTEFMDGKTAARNARSEEERITLRAQCPYQAGTPKAASWLAGFQEAH
jgi:ribosome modulation factor